MLCQRTAVFPVECVIRGYIAGSAWKEYRAHRHAGGRTASGWDAGKRPADAGDLQPGHQGRVRPRREHHHRRGWRRSWAPIPRSGAGAADAARLRASAASMAEPRGIIIADTKFEFGSVGDGSSSIDEVLTPDSSRFWPADRIPARTHAAELRQAAAARLPRRRAGGRALERRRSASSASRRGGGGDERAVPRCVSAHHRVTVGHQLAPHELRARRIRLHRRGGRAGGGRLRARAQRRARGGCGSWRSCSPSSRCGSRTSFATRSGPASAGQGLVIAPADGRVVMITEVDEPAFLQQSRQARSRSS